MSSSIIEIKNINVSYGSNHVLKDVNLNIENKDFYTFLGPSGCGKTTLLRLVAGFEKSSSGELFIDGKEVSNLNPWERDVGMVFQNYALWPHMTVYKNICFGLPINVSVGSEIFVTTVSPNSRLFKDFLISDTEELFEQHQKEVELAKQYGIEIAYQPFGTKLPVEANIQGGDDE